MTQTFPFVLQNYLIFVSYKVTRKLSFLIFKFVRFYTDLNNSHCFSSKFWQLAGFLLKLLVPEIVSNLSNIRLYFAYQSYEGSGLMRTRHIQSYLFSLYLKTVAG